MSTKIKYTDEPLGEIKIVRDFLPSSEDAEDVTAFAERANEPLVSYENVLNVLKASGRLR